MKKVDVIVAANTLNGIALNKIKDDKLKFTLVANFRKLRKAAMAVDEEQRAITEKFQSDFAGEIDVIQQLRASGLPVNDHQEFLKAEKDLQKCIKALMDEEIELDIQRVDLESLVKALKDTDLTMENIGSLDGVIIE